MDVGGMNPVFNRFEQGIFDRLSNRIVAEVYKHHADYRLAMEHAARGLKLVADFGLDMAEGEDAALRGDFIASLVDIGVGSAMAAEIGSMLTDEYRVIQPRRIMPDSGLGPPGPSF